MTMGPIDSLAQQQPPCEDISATYSRGMCRNSAYVKTSQTAVWLM